MLESALDFAILSMDVDGTIISWNPGAERIFGYSAEEAVGESVSLIFSPEDRAAKLPEKTRAIASTFGRSTEERWFLKKDENTFFRQWNSCGDV